MRVREAACWAHLRRAFHAWCETQLARIPGKRKLAKAIRYVLNRWIDFTLFLEDSRVAIDNNPAERAIRPVCMGRKNYLFAWSYTGGDNIADAMTLIERAKLSGLNPHDYLADVLAFINEHKINQLHGLLPWNWKPVTYLGGSKNRQLMCVARDFWLLAI
ncbi:transposase [Acetobacter senegalensis]|uniref:Transposase n=1 Tax=Acetobacter senegalensis TaxID=446692 RepID=A0A0U5F0I8_9PROT|nr:transposase [Acetobacter senegalensis]CEF41873.1 transposase [Acetobacter senegalensis]